MGSSWLRGLMLPILAALSLAARAGLGPENVAIVVNGDSASSVKVADEYAKLRDIPRSNIIVLRQIGGIESTDINQFRDKILAPVMKALRDRGLTAQIQCISYSVDMPYMIDVSSDIHGRPLPKYLTPVGSITGLTYLYEQVLRRDIGYMALDSNRYARKPLRDGKPIMPSEEAQQGLADPTLKATIQTSIDFHHSVAWGEDGQPARTGPHYLLSTTLGVITGRGSSLDEVLACLRRSAAADFTAPKGTIYFEQNGDVRSRVRQWGFLGAAEALKALGVNAVVEDGTIPYERSDIAGSMTGVQNFNWPANHNKILPGAICENFTSFGAVLTKGAGQAACTNLIRNGACGTSGTVHEPYALQEKFPTPFIQVQYAKGFTLAEAFYLSVTGPYQLLVIGDPLCRPWAKRANRIAGKR